MDKQIEEMAKIMEKTFSYAKKYYDDKYEPFELEVYPDEIASELYNSGCRKIHEGVVVLTQSEKQKLLHEMYEQGRFDAIADLEKDGKVVLTREEYQTLKLLAQDKCHYDCPLIDYPDFESERMVRDTTRKETAEKFAKKIQDYLNDKVCEEFGDNACDVTYFTIDVDKVISDVFEIAKEITEGSNGEG